MGGMRLSGLVGAMMLVAVANGCVVEQPRHDDNTYASTQYGTLRVENASAWTIFRVRFSPTYDTQWGQDRLRSDEVIMSGASRDWTVPTGDYNVKIEFEDGRALDSLEVYSVRPNDLASCSVTGGGGAAGGMRGNTQTVRNAYGTGTLMVRNDSTTAIHRVRFSTTQDANWGEDRLRSDEVVMPGSTRTWTVPPGDYNVKIEFADGRMLDSTADVYSVQAGGSASCVVYDVR
jgi:hypothetical protein